MSAERCPACRARLAQEPTCPRCGCDLALVRRAESQARQRLVLAVHAWARDDHALALNLARAAREIEHSPLASALLRCLEQPPAARPDAAATAGAAAAPPDAGS